MGEVRRDRGARLLWLYSRRCWQKGGQTRSRPVVQIRRDLGMGRAVKLGVGGDLERVHR